MALHSGNLSRIFHVLLYGFIICPSLLQYKLLENKHLLFSTRSSSPRTHGRYATITCWKKEWMNEWILHQVLGICKAFYMHCCYSSPTATWHRNYHFLHCTEKHWAHKQICGRSFILQTTLQIQYVYFLGFRAFAIF